MPDFLVERTASTALGNTCATCNTHRHDRGFVNLLIDRPGQGRVYVCADCADQIGRAVGGLDPRMADIKDGQLEEMSVANEALHRELEVERASKVVPLADVVSVFPVVREVADALQAGKLVFLDDHRKPAPKGAAA